MVVPREREIGIREAALIHRDDEAAGAEVYLLADVEKDDRSGVKAIFVMMDEIEIATQSLTQ